METIETRHRGDYMGDKLVITDHHVGLAKAVFPFVKIIADRGAKYTLSFGGPSGSGKSETASLIGDMIEDNLNQQSRVVACDNYPLRPPSINDANREAIFETDGKEGLRRYLGTTEEIDFQRLIGLADSFKSGEDSITLRIIDRVNSVVYNDKSVTDVSALKAMIFEGTWSCLIKPVDLKVFLYATPEETMAHRKARNRDGGVGSPIVETVLGIEQEKLEHISREIAHLIVYRDHTVKITDVGRNLGLTQ
jgi:alpha-galactosidase